jgi:hypothetical protein
MLRRFHDYMHYASEALLMKAMKHYTICTYQSEGVYRYFGATLIMCVLIMDINRITFIIQKTTTYLKVMLFTFLIKNIFCQISPQVPNGRVQYV